MKNGSVCRIARIGLIAASNQRNFQASMPRKRPRKNAIGAATAITDSVYRFMPAVMSPEDLTGFHGTNERLTVENMGRLSKGYAQIILAMDANED